MNRCWVGTLILGGLLFPLAASQAETAQGDAVGSGGASIASATAAASAAGSTARVPGVGTVGQVTTITVQACDANGNKLTTGGAPLTVTITGANSATPAVTDNGDGTYTVSYTPARGGTDIIAVTLQAFRP